MLRSDVTIRINRSLKLNFGVLVLFHMHTLAQCRLRESFLIFAKKRTVFMPILYATEQSFLLSPFKLLMVTSVNMFSNNLGIRTYVLIIY